MEEWSHSLQELLRNFKPQDIYNLDELALFYRLLPTKTYAFKNEERNGSKKSKDRITIAMIANYDGSDKMAIMIGKSAKPRAFRKLKSLPIDYYSQINAWMNSDIFLKILRKLNSKCRQQKRKILLLVDQCRAHTSDLDFSNILLKYLPVNSTSVLQVC